MPGRTTTWRSIFRPRRLDRFSKTEMEPQTASGAAASPQGDSVARRVEPDAVVAGRTTTRRRNPNGLSAATRTEGTSRRRSLADGLSLFRPARQVAHGLLFVVVLAVEVEHGLEELEHLLELESEVGALDLELVDRLFDVRGAWRCG